MKYLHVFFDLDRTLWDFDSSAKIAFGEIFVKFDLASRGISGVDDFQEAYTLHNERLWSLYRDGKIKKEVLRGKRFRLTLAEFGIDDTELAELIGNEYVTISPLRVALFPYAEEILDYIGKKYQVHLITNGFSEVQKVKLQSSGLGRYFHEVVTSEEAGFKKPDQRIFNYAFAKTGAKPEKSIMIGDDPEVDILGAREVGMDQVLFDPKRQFKQNGSTYHIHNLRELQHIL